MDKRSKEKEVAPSGGNQHIFRVMPNQYLQWFMYYHLRTAIDFFQGIAADNATTMGHIKREHLCRALLALPPDHGAMEAVGRLIGPLYHRIYCNQRRNARPAAFGDALLPRLMSGDLHI